MGVSCKIITITSTLKLMANPCYVCFLPADMPEPVSANATSSNEITSNATASNETTESTPSGNRKLLANGNGNGNSNGNGNNHAKEAGAVGAGAGAGAGKLSRPPHPRGPRVVSCSAAITAASCKTMNLHYACYS
jgi:hypothetical protein